MERLDQMIETVLPLVAIACERAILPGLKRRRARVVAHADDRDQVVTELDLRANDILLNGTESLAGLNQILPGTFSEECDHPKERQQALDIFEIDPLDGTGDMVRTIGGPNMFSPTCLVSRLTRGSVSENFVPVASLVYDVLHGYAVIADGCNLVIMKKSSTGFDRVEYSLCCPSYRAVRIGRRTSYPQQNAHEHLPKFMIQNGVGEIVQVPTGGAGRQILQLVRSVIAPCDPLALTAFSQLPPIDVLVDSQRNWKTWDLDPVIPITHSLSLPTPVSLFGRPLRSNASAPTLSDMYHQEGAILGATIGFQDLLVAMVAKFQQAHPELDLFEQNY